MIALLFSTALAADGWVDPNALPQTRLMDHQNVQPPNPITTFKVQFLTASPWTTTPGNHWPCDAFPDFCSSGGTWDDLGAGMLPSSNFNWMKVTPTQCTPIPSTPGWFTGTVYKDATCMLTQSIQDSNTGITYNWNLAGDIGTVECMWEWDCDAGICDPDPIGVKMLAGGYPSCDRHPNGNPIVTYVSPGSDPLEGIIFSFFTPIASWWEH